MKQLLAHLALLGRHRRETVIGGYHWSYCNHRSHALGLACWRWKNHHGYCPTHNESCWEACPEDSFAVDFYDTDHESHF